MSEITWVEIQFVWSDSGLQETNQCRLALIQPHAQVKKISEGVL